LIHFYKRFYKCIVTESEEEAIIMEFQGLETAYAAVRQDLKTPGDVLVLFVHWKLAKEGFLCTGSGTQSSSPGSELLPSGWNTEPTVFKINYTLKTVAFVLQVVLAGDSVIVNILRCTDNKFGDATITLQDHISEDLTTFGDLFKNKAELLSIINSLIDPLTKEKTPEKRKAQQDDYDPLRVGGRPRPDAGPPDWEGPGVPGIGSSDLDPLGGIVGGGMIMDPTGGVRPMQPSWDPVGPLHPGDLGGPGPLAGGRGSRGGRGGGRRNFGDAMRPPGWDHDNMYM